MSGKCKNVKCLALFVIMILMVSSFVSCTQPPAASSTSSSSSGSTSAVGSEAPAQVAEPENKEFKYLLRGVNNRETQPGNQMVLDEIQKESGYIYHLEVIPAENYREKVNIMLAASEPFDGMDMIAMEHWAVLQNRGHLMELTELMPQYAPDYYKLLQDNDIVKYCTDKDGKMWSIPRREPHPNGNVPSIRKDWLEKLGMKEPTTLAEYEAYMEAVLKTDLNGNGQHDEIPLTTREAAQIHEFLPFFTGNYGKIDEARFKTEDGKIMPVVAHPGYADMLAKYREWYEKGYLYNEFITLKTNQFNDLVIANRVGSCMEWYSSAVRPCLELQKSVPEADYISLRCFTDAPETGKPAWGYGGAFSGGAAIPKSSKNPEAVLGFLNWVYKEQSNFLLTYYGLENQHWKWAEQANNLIEIIDNPSIKYDGMYPPIEFFLGEFKLRTSGSDPVINRYREMQDVLNGDDYVFVERFDAFIPYVLRGTPAEVLTGDGTTMIDEARLRCITGEITIEEWNETVKKYMELEGNILSEVWTQQYNEFMAMLS